MNLTLTGHSQDKMDIGKQRLTYLTSSGGMGLKILAVSRVSAHAHL